MGVGPFSQVISWFIVQFPTLIFSIALYMIMHYKNSCQFDGFSFSDSAKQHLSCSQNFVSELLYISVSLLSALLTSLLLASFIFRFNHQLNHLLDFVLEIRRFRPALYFFFAPNTDKLVPLLIMSGMLILLIGATIILKINDFSFVTSPLKN